MTKNLLFLFLLFTGFSFFQSKNKAEENLKSEFFCDLFAPTNVQATNITMTSGTITWTNDPNTSQYILRFRPYGVGAAWSSFTAISINAFTLAGLMPCTSYEVQVAKVCSNVAGAWSDSIVFTTYLFNYCASSSTASNVAYISNVTVTPTGTGIYPMVSNSGTSNYTDYRPDSSRKVELMIGSANNSISVSKTWLGTPNAVSVRAWIDFDGDGAFQASEMILSSNSTTLPTATSTFNVPATAFQTGTTCGVAMRVIISETFTSSVCGTFTYGEVEDYGVYLLMPANLSTKEINKNKDANIYPNPTSDILNISGVEGNEFEIYNVVGQKVSDGKISDQKVNVRDLAKGVYFIQIKDKENVTRLKFIKK